MRSKAWGDGYRCFRADSQPLAVVHITYMARYVAALSDREQEVFALFETHGLDWEQSMAALRVASRTAHADGVDLAAEATVRQFPAHVEDPERLFTATATWLDRRFGRGPSGQPAPCEVQGVEAADDAATATLTVLRATYPVHVGRVDGRWYMTLPKAQFVPRQWKEVFIVDFLDALHGWKM